MGLIGFPQHYQVNNGKFLTELMVKMFLLWNLFTVLAAALEGGRSSTKKIESDSFGFSIIIIFDTSVLMWMVSHKQHKVTDHMGNTVCNTLKTGNRITEHPWKLLKYASNLWRKPIKDLLNIPKKSTSYHLIITIGEKLSLEIILIPSWSKCIHEQCLVGLDKQKRF